MSARTKQPRMSRREALETMGTLAVGVAASPMIDRFGGLAVYRAKVDVVAGSRPSRPN
jgi:hypothetical protein